MDTPIPKPKPPKKPIASNPLGLRDVDMSKTEPKKPFVPKPHLTSSPFRDNQDLRELQKNLHKDYPPVKRSPRTTKKAQEKK